MKAGFLWLLIMALTLQASAQSSGETNVCYNGICFDVFTISIDTVALNRLHLVQNTRGNDHKSFYNSISKGKNIMAINAAIDGDNCQPVGLRVVDGQQTNPLDLGSGQGNFYLKPNGVFLATPTSVHIVESSQYSRYSSNVQTAVQSGPMLLIDKSIHPEFKPASTNLQIRSGVGIKQVKGQTQIVFVVSRDPVRLYDFSVFFRDYLGCSNALCLQSVNCSMTMPFHQSAAIGTSNVNCYAITLEH